MLIFIDDSGDPGFKLAKGSSAVFVIALIIFDDNLIAEETALALKKLRRDLKFPDDAEFKFHKSRLRIKERFLEVASKFQYRVRAIIIRKEKIHSNFLRTSIDSFFNYTVMELLKNSGRTIKRAKLRFDRRGERRIRNELRTYLSRELNNKKNNVFTDLKFADSKENILIQLADMIAGTIASYYKGQNKELLQLVKKRIEDLWEFK
ncbi:DUF3800 domain-containing protein [Candidatus Roizmanbacteria bacterium]|nr:DUF3800 domain-containing protein [Candidatus Roizmanbacteria bacterium]